MPKPKAAAHTPRANETKSYADFLSDDLVKAFPDVPREIHEFFEDIVTLTDNFCDELLNDEYKLQCRRLACAACATDLPLKRGKREGWACGIAYSVGWVNFLSDPNNEPHLPSNDVAKAFGVSPGTMHKKATSLRDALQLVRFHPDFTLPSLWEVNPLMWTLEVNESLFDVRGAPRVVQSAAFDKGLIPYIPADGPPEGVAELGSTSRRDSSPLTANLVLQFKITLLGSEPLIWRRIQVVPETLGDLHLAVQDAMGWENYHIFELVAGGVRYGTPSPDSFGFFGDECEDAFETSLMSLVSENKRKKLKLRYTYDFGDGWEHEIVLEDRLAPARKTTYPVCIDGENACPPEDCGGIWGYYDMLAAVNDKSHPEYHDYREWLGKFDPSEFSARAATRRMRRQG